MRPRGFFLAIGVMLPIAFVAGWLASRGGIGAPDRDARTVLYYVDPMNPAFHSPKPGTAPCGMPLEPVYADQTAPGAAGTGPAVAVSVRPDRLQLIGIAREQVRLKTLQSTLRAVGTVAADESRVYRISAATAGRVMEIGGVTTGSQVAKGEVLGAYYSSEMWNPQLSFLRMNEAYQNVLKTGANARDTFQGEGQLAAYWRNFDISRQTLMNLGMPAEQIDEVAAKDQPAYLVQMRAPAAGFVTAKNVVLGQTFPAGDELFAIADLSRVWVLADVFEGQEQLFQPGRQATVAAPGSGRRFAAVVSRVLPRFEPATRTLKVRLEVRNSDFALRPDMFVDVEFPVEAGPALFVPQEAVLDTGTRKIVFVEQEAGVFVARPVSTGRRVGGQVEVRGGLMVGETVVTAGNFLLDSESRMRAAGAATAAAGSALDPICGMEVDEARARAQGLVSEHGGATWFFCTPGCKQNFDRGPAAAAARASGTAAAVAEPAATHEAGMKSLPVADPVCGMEVDPAVAVRAGLTAHFLGAPFSFCSRECKERFERDPHAVLSQAPGARSVPPGAKPATAMGAEKAPRAPAGRGMAEHGKPSHGEMGHLEARHDMPAPLPTGAPAGMETMKAEKATGAEAMPMAVDPACGMPVDPDHSRSQGLVSEHGGKAWFFCTPECKRDFDANPDDYPPPGR